MPYLTHTSEYQGWSILDDSSVVERGRVKVLGS